MSFSVTDDVPSVAEATLGVVTMVGFAALTVVRSAVALFSLAELLLPSPV